MRGRPAAPVITPGTAGAGANNVNVTFQMLTLPNEYDMQKVVREIKKRLDREAT